MDALFQRDAYTRSLIVALFLATASLVAMQLSALPAVLFDPTLAESPTDAGRGTVFLLMALNFAGMAFIGAVYLLYRGHGWSYLDLRVPTLREWGYVLVGTVVAIIVMYLVNILSMVLELPQTENQIMEFIGDDPTMVLIMLAVVFLFNAPAEEFLFRNVIQKRLYAAFSPLGAVAATSVIFAVVHIPAYGIQADLTFVEPLALVPVMITLFIGSLIFGYLYVITENLVVPIAAHAFYNAFLFGLLYLALEFFPEEVENMLILGELVAALPL